MGAIAREIQRKGYIPMEYFMNMDSSRGYVRRDTGEIVDERFVEAIVPAIIVEFDKKLGLIGLIDKGIAETLVGINAVAIKSRSEVYFLSFSEDEYNKQKQIAKSPSSLGAGLTPYIEEKK
jgi:hypothetical protein